MRDMARASGTQQHRRRLHPDRQRFDNAIQRRQLLLGCNGRLERNMELTLEQMLIELQARFGHEVLLASNDDGSWELEAGPRKSFNGKTPMAVVVQAYRAGL